MFEETPQNDQPHSLFASIAANWQQTLQLADEDSAWPDYFQLLTACRHIIENAPITLDEARQCNPESCLERSLEVLATALHPFMPNLGELTYYIQPGHIGNLCIRRVHPSRAQTSQPLTETKQTPPQASEPVAQTPQVPWENEEMAAILEVLPKEFHLWSERAVQSEHGKEWAQYALLMTTFAEAFRRAPLTAEACKALDIVAHLNEERSLLAGTIAVMYPDLDPDRPRLDLSVIRFAHPKETV
ncbi:MAG TPA: hypothetical protein VFV38_45035 [Ktedonobacteraceae bacterium]|nr:hypothetical protein [Ktedonobacteraceae bacterium]